MTTGTSCGAPAGRRWPSSSTGSNNDPTNWWAPNHAAVEALLRSAGMRVLSRPGHEIYVCEPDPERPSSVSTWNAAEILSATGRSAVRKGKE